jgi:hypothetical protein
MAVTQKLQSRFEGDRTDRMILRDTQSLDITQFRWQDGYSKYTVQEDETRKPYLISQRNYGTDIYEDILLLLNGVADQFGLRPGAVLLLPRLTELQDFLLENRIVEDNLSLEDPA